MKISYKNNCTFQEIHGTENEVFRGGFPWRDYQDQIT